MSKHSLFPEQSTGNRFVNRTPHPNAGFAIGWINVAIGKAANRVMFRTLIDPLDGKTSHPMEP
jgi:hypothetical protein